MKKSLYVITIFLISLILAPVVVIAETEPNFSPSNATVINLNEEHSGNLSSPSDEDYYKFVLPVDGNIVVTLRHEVLINSSRTYWRAYLYSENDLNTVLRQLDLQGNEFSASFQESLPRGVYYIRIGVYLGSIHSAQQYYLKVNSVPPPPTTTTTPGTPTVDLDSPKTDLRTGDSFILDLVLKSGGSKSPIDLYFSIEMGGLFPTTIYLGPNLKFVPDRIAVVSNLIPIDTRVGMFGPAPSISESSILGEFIITSDVTGSFTFVAEVVDSGTKASVSRDSLSITVNVRP